MDAGLNYTEILIAIVDRKVKTLRNKEIPLVQVRPMATLKGVRDDLGIGVIDAGTTSRVVCGA